MSGLRVTVRFDGEERAYVHDEGSLEIGRGPGSGRPRITVLDPTVSRDHVRITPASPGWLEVENLSNSSDVFHDRGPGLGLGDSQVVPLPVVLSLGHTDVVIETEPEAEGAPPWTQPGASYAPSDQALAATDPGDGWASPVAAEYAPAMPAAVGQPWAEDAPDLAAGLSTIVSPVAPNEAHALRDLGTAPDAETLTRWFETLVVVQQAAATSAEFLDATAKAVVELVGMDIGLVLLWDGSEWQIAARSSTFGMSASMFSSTVLSEVVRLRRTVFRNLGAEATTASLVGIETVVAAPMLDAEQTVIGAVYGSRSLRAGYPSPDITELEAGVVQVLAAAAGAGIARQRERESALRSQFTFEQFFSADLARQLVVDPSLLEGRNREVTLLFSDVRNFSRISEHLGPAPTFEMMQEIMGLQTRHIRDTQGVVVDYVGDGLLAMWNAPTDLPDHPWLAAQAGQRIVEELPALSARWEPITGEPVRLGIGINTGTALVGNTGSSIKFKYGPMGPPVNLASRVENATKSVGVGLLLTRTTRERLPAAAPTRRVGSLRLQGVADPVDVFELVAGTPGPEWYVWRDRFEHALWLFETRQWSEACREFAELVSSVGGYDMPTLQLLSRSVECLRSNPVDFDPALVVEKSA